MANIELPKDAEGREIPLDTKILYNEDGKRFDVNRFTYSVVQTIPDLKWGVVFMDCSYDYCISFYLTPPESPDSWEKLEEDLSNGMFGASPGCAYAGNEAYSCDKCCFESARHCTRRIFTDIRNRIRKLRGVD